MRPFSTLRLLLALAFAVAQCQLVSAQSSPSVRYPRLSKTLDSLAYVDQWPMQRIARQGPDSAGRSLFDVEKENYARHQPVLEKIARQIDYPGYREVGKRSANNFWLLVQHADAHPEF